MKSTPDPVLRSVLERSYSRFSMFYKSLKHQSSTGTLNQCLDEFYSSFLEQLDFSLIDSVVNGIFADSSPGISYMNMQQSTYLAVLDFAHDLESRLKGTRGKILLLWKHFLVWGNHDTASEVQCLVEYITDPQTGKNWDMYINQVKNKNEVVTFSTKF